MKLPDANRLVTELREFEREAANAIEGAKMVISMGMPVLPRGVVVQAG